MSDVEQAVSELESTVSDEGKTTEAPFNYTYTSDDGEERAFDSTDSLSKYIKESGLRHSDYTKKTQAIGDQRREVEALRAELNKERKSVTDMRTKYDPIDQYLRTPTGQKVFTELQGKYQGVSHNDVNDQAEYVANAKVDGATKELLAKIEALEERNRASDEVDDRTSAYDSLSSEYEDFDKDAVEAAVKQLDELSSLPQKEQTKEFMRLVYKSLRADTSSAKLEQKSVLTKTKPPPLKTKGAKATIEEAEPDNLDQAEEMAVAALKAEGIT